MATPEGGKPFEPGMIERAAAGLRYMFTGQTPPWFGPNEPLKPQAPEEVKGRPLDFPVGVNLSYQPRSEGTGDSGVSFALLRRMADPAQGGLDLLRLAIETRKDQMEAQRWKIQGKDGKDGGQRAKDLMVALRRPDLVHTFRQWSRTLWEDLLVIDAPTVYVRPMAEGFSIPEIMDGALVKILVDPNGRRPLPPEPAYQQVLKGLPAVDYTLDELLYMPRNLRSYRFYGMGPVEQLVNLINLALKRQTSLTGYYTAGNVPEHLIGVPETWNPDQTKAFQEWFDAVLEGNVRKKRKLYFIPGGMQPVPLKDPKLQDPLDEWLARVICWCFSLPPSALVKEVNRATAETAQETGQQEGLEPLKEWWADFMNEVLFRCWGVDDLEFAWADEEISDPKTKADVLSAYVAAKIMHPDEAREKLRLDPLTPEQKEEMNPAPLMMLGGEEGLEAPGKGGGKTGAKPGTSQGEAGDDSASRSLPPDQKKAGVIVISQAEIEGHALTDEQRAFAKLLAQELQKKKKVQPINRNRAAVKRAVKAIRTASREYLDAVLSAFKRDLEKVQKADLTADRVKEILASLSAEERPAFLKALKAAMGDAAKAGVEAGLTQVIEYVPAGEDEIIAMLDQANERAIAWAEDHAADLVTRIDETTRDQINGLVGKALEEGWSNDELAGQIQDAEGFSDYRCEMIARTETAFADVQGNLQGYAASGVVEGKEWIVAQDEVCEDCQALDGMVVSLDGSFPGGDPPLHPNCRCDVLPVLTPGIEAED